jgi:hypothetical protein
MAEFSVTNDCRFTLNRSTSLDSLLSKRKFAIPEDSILCKHEFALSAHSCAPKNFIERMGFSYVPTQVFVNGGDDSVPCKNDTAYRDEYPLEVETLAQPSCRVTVLSSMHDFTRRNNEFNIAMNRVKGTDLARKIKSDKVSVKGSIEPIASCVYSDDEEARLKVYYGDKGKKALCRRSSYSEEYNRRESGRKAAREMSANLIRAQKVRNDLSCKFIPKSAASSKKKRVTRFSNVKINDPKSCEACQESK